jgi:flagellar biosynthetic protein FliO
MNLSIFTKLFLLLLIIAALASISFAQAETPANLEQKNQTAPVFGENDRLPFMQTENPRDSNEPSSSGLLFKTLGAMLLIIGLIFFGAWGLKKVGFGGGTKAGLAVNAPDLSVLSTVSLGTNRTLSVVKFGEQMLLIGSTPQNFTLLADTKSEKPISMRQSRSVAELLAEDDRSFAEEFAQAQSKLSLMDERGELI